MIEKDKQILKKFASSVKHKFSDAIILGFGSRIRGNHSEDSIKNFLLYHKSEQEIFSIMQKNL
jgi:predicted nucleotidyltransferase